VIERGGYAGGRARLDSIFAALRLSQRQNISQSLDTFLNGSPVDMGVT